MLCGKALIASVKSSGIASKAFSMGKWQSANLITRSFTNTRTDTSPVSGLKVGVISAPFAMGTPKRGVSEGPEAIIKTGFIPKLQEAGIDIKDYGTIDFSQIDETVSNLQVGDVEVQNPLQVGLANKLIAESAAQIARDGRICLTLGGDHSIAIGSISGVMDVHEDLAVLWVDAHSDINTPSTTWSGRFHGMPLGFLLKELEQYVMKIDQFSWIKPKLQAKNLAYIGLRDVDPYEREIIESFGITAFSMKEVSSMGIETVVNLALEKICPGGKRPLHVSFDIDALDEPVATSYPVPGGLTLREALTLVEQVRQAGNLVGMDLVEVNPLIGTDLDVVRTTLIAKHLLLHTFGYYRGGVSKKPLPIPGIQMHR